MLKHRAQADCALFCFYIFTLLFQRHCGNKAFTVLVLALNRPILKEVRRDKLEELVTLRRVVNLKVQLSASQEGLELLRKAEAMLAHAVSDQAEFSGMARAAAKRDFRPLQCLFVMKVLLEIPCK